MCRLLGIYGQTDIWQEIVLEFSQQAEFGHIPPGENQKPGHRDGWGLTTANHNSTAMIPPVRQLGSACDNPAFREVVYALPGAPEILLGHLRKASENIPVTLANTHPFFHNGWALIHNGTVFTAEFLPRDTSLLFTSDGSDTEHFFHYLLTKITNRSPGRTVARTIADAVAAVDVDYTALNCMLSDGRELYVVRLNKKWDAYYTLHYYTLPGSIVISSQPIESPRLKPHLWKKLPNGRLMRLYDRPFKMDVIDIL